MRVAVASGLGNARALCKAILSGEKQYEFRRDHGLPRRLRRRRRTSPSTTAKSARWSVVRVLYGLDKVSELRFSHENPAVGALYEEYLGQPLSERAEHLLHTDHEGWIMPPPSRLRQRVTRYNKPPPTK